MGPREGDVAATDRLQAFSRSVGRTHSGLHPCGDPLEAHRGEIAQQARHVAEVIFRGCVRHTRFAGRGPQRQPLDAVPLQDALCSPQQRPAQRPVMIGGRTLGHAHLSARFLGRLLTPHSGGAHSEVIS